MASSQKLRFAKSQRKEATQAEDILWQTLRRNDLGVKFRRQHAIGDFVLDFYCNPARLCIEVDGEVHKEQREYDEWRDQQLQVKGIETLRISAGAVARDMDDVLEIIKRRIAERMG